MARGWFGFLGPMRDSLLQLLWRKAQKCKGANCKQEHLWTLHSASKDQLLFRVLSVLRADSLPLPSHS